MCSLFDTDLLLCNGIPTKRGTKQKLEQRPPVHPQYLEQCLTQQTRDRQALSTRCRSKRTDSEGPGKS